ncbi:primosomal protein N' [Algicola sagamiensis]|uniref:primosomal protein N' n=1 Tax=Algicola sagamiensis TaxID=163869 RepID=UPI00037E3B39|nr:primosomal protein N' [Algicola sagamiensis]
MSTAFLQVALPVPMRTVFDYKTDASGKILPGCRVRVPFGKRQMIGVVVGTSDQPNFDPDKIKSIDTCLDSSPIYEPTLFEALRWAASYFQAPIGEVLFHALPPQLREGKNISACRPEQIQLTTLGKKHLLHATVRGEKQKLALQALEKWPQSRAKLKTLGVSPATIKSLLDKQWVEKKIETPLSCDFTQLTIQDEKHLNPEQALAVTTITKQLDRFQTYLLDGVTGSGKTEVYLQTIRQVLATGKQVLILVPEIGLTPQTLQRFEQRFNLPLYPWHSALNDTEKFTAWDAARTGSAAMIIGTRSASLLPFQNLGLIVVDEEHDLSFKQQEGFRYHARDFVIYRAWKTQVPVILGSATPSLESLYNVHQQKYQHLLLTKSAMQSHQTQFELVDMKQQKLHLGLSSQVLVEIKATLSRGEQVLLFLNRRGYANALLCHECGWLTECSRCSAFTTYHKIWQQMVCHHCSSTAPVPHQCLECGSTQLVSVGHGTEQIEEGLSEQFPDTTIYRIDRDSTRRKGSLEKQFSDILKGKPCLIIGTQMLAKGHHFPRVSLAVIIDVDGGLYSADFRAQERLAQLIVQVAGRAGRAAIAGKVLMQTHHPEHPLLQDLINNGYAHFSRLALEERQAAQFPPIRQMALVRVSSLDAQACQSFIEGLKVALSPIEELQAFGPMPALLEKKAGKFRFQLQMIAKKRSTIQKAAATLLTAIPKLPTHRQVKWSLDIDPQDLY